MSNQQKILFHGLSFMRSAAFFAHHVRGESTTPSITIIFPNGGEIWRVKTSQTIKWKYTRDPGNYVKIELLKGGVANRTIASRVRIGSNESGSYKWKISSTQTPGNDYTIRVSSTINSLYSDTSNNTFTITEQNH